METGGTDTKQVLLVLRDNQISSHVFIIIAHKWCVVVVLVFQTRFPVSLFLQSGSLIERCHIYSSLLVFVVAGNHGPTEKTELFYFISRSEMETNKSFGVHSYTSHVITLDYLLLTYKYLTEKLFIVTFANLPIRHSDFDFFLMVDIFVL